ncbi:M23 family metallopeptidase [uncultured Sphingomonas sp.]|uniref:M23 family metallopeptidase n=1 Tax=uncultured Sphingomonas sp. TaxID=158754 RepID=UPI0025E520E2|nr:M23 family metallopeptidase [uncultured Sphingomonas sp.]
MSVLTAARNVALFIVSVSLPLVSAHAGSLAAPQRGDRIEAVGGPVVEASSETPFHSLFTSWKKLDSISSQGVMSVPSAKPVAEATYTSGYGVRSDPFRGSAAMHAGIDLAAPIGTPVYATADGIVSRSEWSGGYGNLVEINHGKGLQTRFGHLSRALVHAGDRVKRGQMIAMMGSTGRSTGSHLHYEVRIDGYAVNPVPFLQSADYVTAMQARTKVALGGPEDANNDPD